MCKKVKGLGVFKETGMRLSNEWAATKVTYSRNGDHQYQLSCLRSNIFKHATSKSHKAAKYTKHTIDVSMQKQVESEAQKTASLFRKHTSWQRRTGHSQTTTNLWCSSKKMALTYWPWYHSSFQIYCKKYNRPHN